MVISGPFRPPHAAGRPLSLRGMVEALESPVRQAFQPDPAVTKRQGVRLESLTYKKECCSAGKQLLESFHWPSEMERSDARGGNAT
jgi:hypothetical protein